MSQIYTFLFTLFFTISVHSQSDMEIIINTVINSEKFIKHLNNQELFKLSEVDYICYNNFTDTTWRITFQGNEIDFNTEEDKITRGFERGYDFKIVDLSKKRRKATLTIKFYPSYHRHLCSNDCDFYTMQTRDLFIELNCTLIKRKGNWVLTIMNFSDDSFENNKDKYPCIYNKYKAIKN